MKKHRYYLIPATLTLGLCLVAAPALARDTYFRVTNDSGHALQVGCSTADGGIVAGVAAGTTTTTQGVVDVGVTQDFACNGTLSLHTSGGTKSSLFECPRDQVQHVTVSGETLDLTEECVAGAEGASVSPGPPPEL